MKYLHKIVIFDLETTGFDFNEDRIIEFGAVVLVKFEKNESLKIVEEHNFLIKPPFPIMNSDIHHITDEMVEKDGISEEEFYKKIKEIITDDAIVVAYNTQFDINFLRTMYKRYEPDYEIENDLLDVMAIYKDRHKYPHKLDNAVEMYNVNVKNTHRALDDVLATYEVFKKLAIENNNINKYINKFGYNPKYGVSGKRFKQVTYIPQKGGNNEIIS